MMVSAINDLDELALRVRDPESRVLFAEAVQAYRAGALRSAVTSTWIVVVYDVLAKIRELSIGGDKNAVGHITTLDNAVANKDIPTLQRIEGAILTIAAQEFELLSPQEFLDLNRLQDDRNLCAHPALIPDHTIFQPTPELVRTHLVHAGLHLLRHPPVQGKNALNRIVAEMARPSFPDDLDRAFQVLSERLSRAKEALVRNLTSVLLKTLFFGTDRELAKRLPTVVNGLTAIARIHASIYEREVKNALDKWPKELGDEQLVSVFRLIGADPRCWGWLSSASKVRALEFARKSRASDLAKAGAFDALVVPEIRDLLLGSFSSLDQLEKQSVIADNPRPEFAAEAIQLFSQARSFRGAESLGLSVVLPMAAHFSGEHIVKILRAAKENGQIWDAGGMREILERLFDATQDRLNITSGAWPDFMVFIQQRGSNDWYLGLWQRLVNRGLATGPSPG